MKKRKIYIIVGVSIAILALVFIGWMAYLHFWMGYAWAGGTGFEGKTLWDLMELLIIPAFLAGAVYVFSRSEKRNELRIASDRQQESTLQNYLDKMADLLLKEDLLGNRDISNPIFAVAQVRTVTTIRTLDKERRNILFQFLRDAKLYNFILVSASLNNAILTEAILPNVNLENADLVEANLENAFLMTANLGRALLINANLKRANMMKANFEGATLNTANLGRAILVNANLEGAFLYGANLERAYLVGANLKRANLNEANLKGAYLDRADLSGAVVSKVQLDTAASLIDAILSNINEPN